MSAFVRDISFTTDEIGFVAGSGGILKTTDTGDTWQLNYTSDFICLADCCTHNKSINGFTAIAFDGSDIGVAAGKQFLPELFHELPNKKAYIARTTTL